MVLRCQSFVSYQDIVHYALGDLTLEIIYMLKLAAQLCMLINIFIVNCVVDFRANVHILIVVRQLTLNGV